VKSIRPQKVLLGALAVLNGIGFSMLIGSIATVFGAKNTMATHVTTIASGTVSSFSTAWSAIKRLFNPLADKKSKVDLSPPAEVVRAEVHDDKPQPLTRDDGDDETVIPEHVINLGNREIPSSNTTKEIDDSTPDNTTSKNGNTVATDSLAFALCRQGIFSSKPTVDIALSKQDIVSPKTANDIAVCKQGIFSSKKAEIENDRLPVYKQMCSQRLDEAALDSEEPVAACAA